MSLLVAVWYPPFSLRSVRPSVCLMRGINFLHFARSIPSRPHYLLRIRERWWNKVCVRDGNGGHRDVPKIFHDLKWLAGWLAGVRARALFVWEFFPPNFPRLTKRGWGLSMLDSKNAPLAPDSRPKFTSQSNNNLRACGVASDAGKERGAWEEDSAGKSVDNG